MADDRRSTVQGERPRTGHPEAATEKPAAPPREVGGPTGPEPTRYGDWERNGRCYDF